MQKSDADIERNLFLELIQVGNCCWTCCTVCFKIRKIFYEKKNNNRLFFLLHEKKPTRIFCYETEYSYILAHLYFVFGKSQYI